MVVSDQRATGCAYVVASRLMLPAIVLAAAVLMSGPTADLLGAAKWEPVTQTAACRGINGSALPEGAALVIWHKPGDLVHGDRQRLEQIFRGQFQLIWQDVSQRNVALAARAAGVGGVPTIDAWHASEASYVRFEGYKSAGQFLQRLQGAGLIAGNTAAPENPPAMPAVPRRRSQELPLTRDVADGLSVRLDELGARVRSVEDAQANLLAACQQAVQDWNGAAAGWQQTITTLDEGLQELQQQVAGLENGAAFIDESEPEEQSVSGENKELSGTHPSSGVSAPPKAGGLWSKVRWLGFTGLQLAAIAGISMATGGTGVLAWWAGNSIKRRIIAFFARRVASRVAKRLRGRSEVRPQEQDFPRIHRPAQGDGVPVPGSGRPSGPGEYRRTDTGWVRSEHGGDVPDRFEQLAAPPHDQPEQPDH